MAAGQEGTETVGRLERLADELEQATVALEDAREEAAALASERNTLQTEVLALRAALAEERAQLARRNEAATEVQRKFEAAAVELASRRATEAITGEELQVSLEELRVTAEELGEANAALARLNEELHEEVAVRTAELTEANAALRESEARLRLIIESARDYAIFITDAQDRISDWMPGAAAVFGWTAAEVVGRPGAMLFTPEDQKAGIPAWEIETARREGAAPNVRWHLRKDGSRVFIEGTVRALLRPDGGTQGFLKIGQDVTERRATEEALHESEARLRDLLATLDLGSLMARDLSGTITFWSAGCARLYGWTAEEAIGRPAQELLRTSFPVPQAEIEAALERDGEWAGDLRQCVKDGRELVVSTHKVLRRGPDGRPAAVLEAVTDVTTQRQAEAALQESERRLAVELSGAKTLQKISTELIPEQRLEALYGQLLDAAMALMRSDAASVQMLDSAGTHLLLLASKNFHPDSEAYWQRVDAGSASTCGQALRQGKRVVVSDVETCSVMAGTRDLEEYRRSGLRAVQSTPLVSRDGRPLGMISTHWRSVHGPASGDFDLFDVLARQAADLIERAQTEAALQASEARLRLAQEATGIGTWEWDPETGETLWTPEQYALYGLDPVRDGPMTSERFLAGIVHADDRARVEAPLDDLAVAGGTYELLFRARRRRPDGAWETRWMIARGRRIRRADGSPGRMLGVTVDITERQATEARLQELQAELLHVSRLSAAGEMAAALAHELNQPLTAAASAIGAAQLTLASAVPSEGCPEAGGGLREALDFAAEQVLRAGQIVQHLRRFVVRGEADKRLEDLRRLVEEASSLALVGARESGMHASFRLAPRIPPVLVDRIQIQQVLLNLIRNAVDAMTDKGAAAGASPRRELVVAAVPTRHEEVEVSVADTGPGLPPEVADRLFAPFVTTKPGGMGVGLSICRSIVEAHGGRLWAEPNAGGGTVFRFTLPAAPPDGVA